MYIKLTPFNNAGVHRKKQYNAKTHKNKSLIRDFLSLINKIHIKKKFIEKGNFRAYIIKNKFLEIHKKNSHKKEIHKKNNISHKKEIFHKKLIKNINKINSIHINKKVIHT